MNQEELKKFTDWAFGELNIAANPEKKDGGGLSVYSFLEDVVHGIHMEVLKDPESFDRIRTMMLNLLYKKPLTPIEDTDDCWELIFESNDFNRYRCVRYNSLQKGVHHQTGKVVYTDWNRYICVDINDPKKGWTGGIGARILDETLPIIFPYEPLDMPIKVYMDQFSYYSIPEEAENHFDTVAVTHFGLPNGDLMEVHRYFKQVQHKDIFDETLTTNLEEITKEEYFARKKRYLDRKKKKEKK